MVIPKEEDAAWLIMAAVTGQLLREVWLERLSLRRVSRKTETDGLCAIRCVGYQGATRKLRPRGLPIFIRKRTYEIITSGYRFSFISYMFA